jgi:FemAB-related protein (PEP-CTERM system-associated)
VSRATDGAAWDDYVARHPLGTVDHLWDWRPIFDSVLGHSPMYLVATRGDDVCGVLPLVCFQSMLFGRSAISLPFLNYGGLLADDTEVGRALVEAAGREARVFGATHVELRHLARQTDYLTSREHKLSMRLSLPGTSQELWTAIDRKVRNQVRKAQKEGLTTAQGPDLVDEFYAVFARNMRDLGTPVYPKSLFVETVRRFAERARVFVVRLDGHPIAAGMTLFFRGVALNPWASSLREYRNHCPNMLLYWTMLEQALADGATVFDFGRSSPGGGTHQFKLQWGAAETPMHWEYLLLSRAEAPNQGPTNPKFARVIEMWKRLPLGAANAIGPFIARQLP